ncbi:MAG: ABC transporter ATP-binding protein [Tannerellaceae bacterium]|jgi:iron complex transport system ATP-binding protein|nr:ABC transporter ATP-binding protein [Tannerellaceae bacterium]
MFDIRNLSFTYQSNPVLNNISCRIHRGEFVALVGPNGAGKSTLIKCICGILKAKRGTLLINGVTSSSYSAKEIARILAYIPQSESEPMAITVFDMILAGRKPYFSWKPTEEDYQETSDAIRLLGLEDLSMRYANELSGGQLQTVMIARALVQKTSALLLDEPTASLDIRHRTEVMELLKNLSASGLTIVMSVHDINIALHYASHILMLKNGQILGSGAKGSISREQLEQLYDTRLDAVSHNGVLHVIPCGGLS